MFVESCSSQNFTVSGRNLEGESLPCLCSYVLLTYYNYLLPYHCISISKSEKYRIISIYQLINQTINLFLRKQLQRSTPSSVASGTSSSSSSSSQSGFLPLCRQRLVGWNPGYTKGIVGLEVIMISYRFINWYSLSGIPILIASYCHSSTAIGFKFGYNTRFFQIIRYEEHPMPSWRLPDWTIVPLQNHRCWEAHAPIRRLIQGSHFALVCGALAGKILGEPTPYPSSYLLQYVTIPTWGSLVSYYMGNWKGTDILLMALLVRIIFEYVAGGQWHFIKTLQRLGRESSRWLVAPFLLQLSTPRRTSGIWAKVLERNKIYLNKLTIDSPSVGLTIIDHVH